MADVNAVYKPIDDALAKAVAIAQDEHRRYTTGWPGATEDAYSQVEAKKYAEVIALLTKARAESLAIAGGKR